MAHAKTNIPDARILEQCAQGRKIRNVAVCPVIIAKDRAAIDTDSHILATVIDGEVSVNVPIFTAPCAAKITRIYTNAKTYPTTSGASAVICYKAVIGTSDTALNSSLSITGLTAETAYDATLVTTSGVTSLIEGQLVYAIVSLSATTSARSDAFSICVEWMPMDGPNSI